MIRARFDDLRPHRRRSFEMVGLIDTLVASTPAEVGSVLERIESEMASGRWVAGFVAYEAAPAFDPALTVMASVPDLPLAWFSIWKGRGPTRPSRRAPYELGEWLPAVDRSRYEEGVLRIKEHIRQGDTYQVNHTFRMETGFLGDAASFYLDLVRAQSCGYGAFLDTGRFAIASASPELFFEWRHGTILCRPMKGTIRRGLTLTEDEEQRSRLERSDKDRAENLMIVDMVRNDLGRVARTGTVVTPVLFSSEKYDTVWQLTSTVVAEPRKDCRIGDVFAALFPSASITGAPKVATMEIIADLEADPRGIYCGAIGFGGPDAGGDRQWAFNVAIRTVTIDRTNSTARYGTGGGVTYDSTPAGEFAEALLKAAVLARTSADFQLLETIRFDPALGDEGGLWLLDRHLERLIASARYFEIPLDPAEVRAALRSAVAGASEVRRLRLLVDRTGLVTVEDSDPGAASPTEGARVGIDAVPVDEGDPFLYHKTTHRRAYVEALARNPNVDDVILINAAGHVTETSVANLAACLDGVWVTPPVSDGLLPGTFRAELLARGELFERSLTPADLKEATELARFNSVRGWEAVLLDG